MTPGLNLSRFERPLAERRLLGGALRDRWEPADRLPLRHLGTTRTLVRRCAGEGGIVPAVDDVRTPLVWCGMTEVSTVGMRVSDATRGTITASSRHRLAGAEGGSLGARTGFRDPDLHLRGECQ